ncbi:MAG TPA: penicillin-binding protein 2 [Candidatus Pacearchaeota archaeon]|nr:penicillin-binding protein 2 [Candidatus Parcubacteria bacterium]HOC53705.1 penicillin-binding protein 2 [Candidatus Pacearchaeota archaeon]HQM24826.1 penicillin-binding protein 2 [Candidatus Pacearchaeota archaeon]
MANLRANIILFIIFLIGGILLSRLFSLQILDNKFYKAQAAGQQNQIIEEEGKRGDVFFSGGEILAMTKDAPYIFISPEEIQEKEKTADKLSELTGLNKQELISRMNVEGSFYDVIIKEADDDLANKIEKAELKGVHIGYNKKRYYPNETMASKVIGFINTEGKGQYGIEGYYDEQIKGLIKTQKKQNNPWNFIFSSSGSESLDGASLTLTLDYNIQYMAEKLIKQGVKDYKAKGGQIIVMDPYTGQIIAMADYPNYNPNDYKNVSYEVFQNNTIEKLFEPGSIFKPITMSTALNENLVTADTPFNDDKGCIVYDKYKVCNFSEKTYGQTTMTGILEKSINTGVIYVEGLIGHKNFLEYIDSYGLFKKTGIDLSGEVYSSNAELKNSLNTKIEVNFATASFGQGISTTPIQMATAFSVIANGGTLIKPYIVKEISNNEKTETTQTTIVKENIISKETSQELTKMLVSVVENGFGKRGKVDGYYIAAKTGTSEVPWSYLGENKKGYSNETWQSFLGFAPAYNPKFVALVKLDSPETLTSEYSAGPIFHDIAEYILKYWQIEPDIVDKEK